MRASHAGRGSPLLGAVAMYMWRPVRWGTSVPHRYASAASRWWRASRLPSATASHPTHSPSQLSSAAARSVGSMRSKGPSVSPRRDSASSYTGPPVLKCATASRWLRPPREATGMWPLRVPMCISPRPGVRWRCGGRRAGGMGAWMSEDTSSFHPACGPGAACSHSFASASNGWSGPAPRIKVGRGRACCPHPSRGMAAYRCPGVSGARMVPHHGPHLRAHSSPTIRASHVVMEPRLMIHGGKRVSCRGFGKPPGKSWYGWGSSCGGHSRVPFTTRREATNSLSRRRGGGGQLPSAAVSQRRTRAAAPGGSWRSCSSR